MNEVHTTKSQNARSSLFTLKRLPILAAGSFVFGTLMFAAPVLAQTTTTVAGATTTVAGATATTLAPTDTTTVGPVDTADTAADTAAVPAGGVDAGLGGTASDGGSGLVIPIVAGAALVVGFGAWRMSKVRRGN